MERTKQKRRWAPLIEGAALIATLGLLVFVPGCNKQTSGNDITTTPALTESPDMTTTPEPTATTKPTATPRPTATPKPSPTATPTPEPLPVNNLITNATFDAEMTEVTEPAEGEEPTEGEEGKTEVSVLPGWALYLESNGEGAVSVEDGKLALDITNLGTLNYAVQIYAEDVIKLEKDREYRVRFEISCTENRMVEVMLQQNGGSYQCYSWKGVELTPETQSFDYIFLMEQMTDENTKFVINCGTQGEPMGEHTIYLDNVAVSVVDNTNYDKKPEEYEPGIRINQVGYQPESVKEVVFCDLVGEKEFSVVNADTEEVVYTGAVTDEKFTRNTNEINGFGDFTAVKEPGRYYITCGTQKSYVFTVGEDVYDDLLASTVRMFYLQRCGCEVVDDIFGHAACHTGLAKIYGTEEEIEVTGGWHDAGDYGRYMVAAAKAVTDLMQAYQSMENGYNDNLGIPESGNGIPDILDEARYELDWMLKMQAENGGVYHKVSCSQFSGYTMPEIETGQLYVTPVSTTATADFCASMALAYEVYYDIDRDFADTCLAAAEKAWAFLEANPDLIYDNPKTITTGAYQDTNDKDERYWAAAQMYRATKDAKYMTALEGLQVKNGLDWSSVGDYGNIALLTMEGIDKSSAIYTKAYDSYIKQADRLKRTATSNTYGTSNSSFNWGSNMTVSNNGVLLGIAYRLTGDESYLVAAQSNLHYLLGTNPVDTCFVTGQGTVSPQNPHHRPSMAKKQAMPGMLVGGVNSSLDDSIAKSKLKDKPTTKRYIDHKESYSTNEITIYWNSPLVYLLAVAEQ